MGHAWGLRFVLQLGLGSNVIPRPYRVGAGRVQSRVLSPHTLVAAQIGASERSQVYIQPVSAQTLLAIISLATLLPQDTNITALRLPIWIDYSYSPHCNNTFDSFILIRNDFIRHHNVLIKQEVHRGELQQTSRFQIQITQEEPLFPGLTQAGRKACSACPSTITTI
jgi:hypothetical protein